ncbi:AAA family ATPase [Paracoccus sp. S-4012]|uniref:AAA family ATPase n=1 Tax=Paracoccus sp. S-4012 TaxID=2665648 RepID=UPI0012B0DA14|nr:AAA family ATPase [Paracoccus sp. S-4012]MRX50039.1 AAA family ATPase [Paracoccus sp. S-4012]
MSVVYLDHFSLSRSPFGSAPEPALFHNASGHQQALDWIESRVAARAPVLVLTGEEGIGKTTLLRLLRERREGAWAIALVSAFRAHPGRVLVEARDLFGLSGERDGPALAADQIRRFAADRQAQGGFVLLMVDDAQALGVEGLAALQALALDSRAGGALTLLLAGRPELRGLLNAPELQQLQTAQNAHAVLPPLGSAETAAYVAHRLERAGAREPIFDPGAMQVLHYFGLGVPRLINIMARYCLMTAAAEGVTELDGPWVGAALHEASAAGVLSQLEELAAAEGLAQAAPEPATAATVSAAPPEDAPLTGGGAAVSEAKAAEPRREPPTGRPAGERAHRPVLRSDALRGATRADAVPPGAAAASVHGSVAKSRPQAPPPRRRVGLGLSAAVAILVLGTGFAWLQGRHTETPSPGQATKPAATLAAPGRTALRPPDQRPAPLPSPVAVTPEPDVAALMQRALAVEATDPAEAALAYARAALRGRARAAWYLGQMHETGSGLAPAPLMARLWYAAAADLPSAQQRLQALSAADGTTGTPRAAIPVFHARLDSGGSEMIWHQPQGATPARFRVELTGPAGEPLPAMETAVPGLIVRFPVGAWRVTAIGPDGSESEPSALARMLPADD